MIDNAEAIKACGGWFEPAISYTVSPVHTLDGYLEYGQQLKDLGADSIAIKDMAGMLTPYRTERLVKAFNAEIGLPVHVHCHYVGGMAPMNIIKAAEAGAAIADTASAPLSFGNSHPAVETIVAALQESRYDTGYDLDLLFEIADYWEEVRKRGHYKRGVSSLTHMKVYSHQVPGGMMSNLVSAGNPECIRPFDEVMREIPRVRAEVGYPPLVTPMSQIVGTQAVFNVLTGSRWSVVSKEMKDYLCGYYGKAPGPISPEIYKKVVGNADVLPPDVAPASLATTTFEQVKDEIGDLATSEEDVLMYALFPNEARTFLSKHRATEQVDFLLERESSQTKEDDYVDINQIRELVKVVEESGVGEITVEEEGMRISVRMPGSAPAAAAAPVAAAAAPAAPPPAAPATAPAEAAPARPAHWVEVTAPMVGTFYAAPAPGEAPFVKVGDGCRGRDLVYRRSYEARTKLPLLRWAPCAKSALMTPRPLNSARLVLHRAPHGAADAGEGE
ncbi:MAG: pyruvate carboxylase subunit B [Slackia sp.]